MAGSRRRWFLGLLLLLVMAESAFSFGWRGWSCGPTVRVAYYYPVCPPVWPCVYQYPPPCPYPPHWPQPYLPPHPPRPLAQPQPAPPSPKETPLLSPLPKAPPKVTEMRWQGTKPAPRVDEKKSPAAEGPCKVGFWNLTGQDVTVTIDGRSHDLARDRAITLELSRRFVWRLGQGDSRTELVPEERNTFEIILRELPPRKASGL